MATVESYYDDVIDGYWLLCCKMDYHINFIYDWFSTILIYDIPCNNKLFTG